MNILQEHNLEIGNLIKIKKSNTSYEGYIMPPSEKSQDLPIIRLKLTSGYNIGIEIDSETKIEKLEESKVPAKPELKKLTHDPKKDTITIIHTGGTIASRIDYRTGSVFSSFTAEDLITMFPELADKANLKSDLLGNMWSEDMRFAHFTKIAQAVKKHIEEDKPKGIIISEGTDFLANTAAALSFMLEDCPVPVLFVGAQRSSDRGSSDAAMNLLCAADFILHTDFAGVAICMHETINDTYCGIFPATKTRKLHTSRRDAFQAVNSDIIARVEFKTGKIHYIAENYPRRDENKKLNLLDKMEEKVALVKMHPNFNSDQLEFILKNNYKGLVLEGAGLGQLQIGTNDELAEPNAKNKEILQKIIENNTVTYISPLCVHGRIHMHVYSKAVDQTTMGMHGHLNDMLPETAHIKLAWLLGNFPDENIPKLMAKNFRGELNSRLLYRE